MKILVYPTDPNPYQKLLYNSLEQNKNCLITYFNGEKANIYSHIFGLVIFLIKVSYFRLKGYKIFHLHWIAFNSPVLNNYVIIRLLSTIYLIICLYAIKLLGYKLVWTLHNIISHEKEYISDLWASKFTARQADEIIVHSESILKEMRQLHFPLDKKISVIPHGNYEMVYPNTINQQESRQLLHIAREDFVFVFFGHIRHYKGISKLLKTFKNLVKEYPEVRLLIAGKCSENTLEKEILQYKNQLPDNILTYLKYIPDDEIQIYLNCADIIVLPFKKISTTGSAIMALAFKKPIIYPKIGSLSDLPEGLGFAYEQENTKGLYEEMQKAINRKSSLTIYGNNASDYIKSLDWKHISNLTFSVYKSLSV